jgi:hypothetical protein
MTDTPRTAGSRRRDRALAVAGAVAAAVVVWAVGDPLLGNDLIVEQPDREPMDLGFAAFAIFSLVSSLLGWALLAILEKTTSRAALIWTVVALIFLILSFLPLTGVEATSGSKAVLAIAHLAVGGVLIPAFWLTRKENR